MSFSQQEGFKEQVTKFFEIILRTVENYLGEYSEKLAENGYEIMKGKRLKALKMSIFEMDVPETDFGNISRSPQLGIFDFRAWCHCLAFSETGLFVPCMMRYL